ncbi:MAG: histidine phosphatase family protein [Burkholderiales bacterium]|nr:histidine phosphatase family protein [Burkholderiales bacterium]
MPEPQAIPLLRHPFYFVRHGETESNLRGTVAGTTDVPLTERGHLQAGAAADILKPLGITAVYASALRRARDTAGHIAAALVLPVTVIPELGERNWGELEGKPGELRMRGMTPPGAETPEQFSRRVLRALAKIDADGAPLIVAHSGVFRVLCRTLGIAEPEAPVANCQPVRFVPPDDKQRAAWRFEVL